MRTEVPGMGADPGGPNRRVVDRVVISLTGSERLETFLRQDAANSFRVHEAFDGRSGAGDELFGVEEFERRIGSRPTGAQIGCALSHAAVLTAFAAADREPGDCILIAEDDVLLPLDFERVLGGILRSGSDFDLAVLADPFGGTVSLGSRLASDPLASAMSLKCVRLPREHGLSLRLGRVEGPVWGGSLYLISHASSKRFVSFLNEAKKPHWVADDYGVWASAAGIRVRVLRPSLVTWFGESTLRPGLANESLTTRQRRSLRETISIRSELACGTYSG